MPLRSPSSAGPAASFKPRADSAAEAETAAERAAIAAMRQRVRGTQINEKTLLATDYLNHFNEINMILESLPDCPDMLEDAKAWAPKSYSDHFHEAGLSYGGLAVAAYQLAPPAFRKPLDLIVRRLDRFILEAVAEADRAIAAGDPARLLAVRDLARKAQAWTARASGFIHGTAPALTQEEIDTVLGDRGGRASQSA
jgi:hypothetical protein